MEKKEPKIKILVACHKADPAIRQDDIYMPIHVGKALHPELDLGFQGDDTGDNISEKNGSYCELTAMYWAWKNLPKDVDIVGLCHYRRYFDITETEIKVCLSKYDVIIPDPNILAWPLEKELALWTSLEDVYLLIEILRLRFPEYRNIIDDYFFTSNKFYRLNMFLMSRREFNCYCEFLFDILYEFEKKSREYPYCRQRRVYGYLGEILMGVWINIYMKKFYKTYVNEPGATKLKRLIIGIRNYLSFVIINPRRIKPQKPVLTGLEIDGYILSTY